MIPQKNKAPRKSHFIISQPGYFDSSRGSQQCMFFVPRKCALCKRGRTLQWINTYSLLYHCFSHVLRDIIYHWDLLGVCTKCPNIIYNYCMLKWDITYYIYIYYDDMGRNIQIHHLFCCESHWIDWSVDQTISTRAENLWDNAECFELNFVGIVALVNLWFIVLVPYQLLSLTDLFTQWLSDTSISHQIIG